MIDSKINCAICDSEMKFYLEKNFEGSFGLNEIFYYKCPNCDFVSSRTFLDMSEEQWSELNIQLHFHLKESRERYFKKALFLHLCERVKLIEGKSWLDWGCGDADLQKILFRYFNKGIYVYDKYIRGKNNYDFVKKESPFDFVICTSVFEHLRTRQDMNEIQKHISPIGCFAIHTVVIECVPKDKDWFYFIPGHCSFFTGRSMKLLMKQWNYKCSIYNPAARLWIFFKEDLHFVEQRMRELKDLLKEDEICYEKGFTDYWGGRH